MSKYRLSQKSLSELEGVHPELVKVVKRAIELTDQDFTVLDGIRTEAEQRKYVRRGVSQTMNSKHLPQDNGWGYAVDLVPWINGTPRWEWDAIYPIAEAMRAAGEELGVMLRWGGNWSTLTGTTTPPKTLVEAYVAERRQQGRSAFVDGPHYEFVGTMVPRETFEENEGSRSSIEPLASPLEERVEKLERRVDALERG